MAANVRTDDTLMVVYRKYWCANIAGRFGESNGTKRSVKWCVKW